MGYDSLSLSLFPYETAFIRLRERFDDRRSAISIRSLSQSERTRIVGREKEERSATRRPRGGTHRLSAFAGRSPYLERPSVRRRRGRAHNLKRVYVVCAPSGVHTAARSHSPYISLRRAALRGGGGTAVAVANVDRGGKKSRLWLATSSLLAYPLARWVHRQTGWQRRRRRRREKRGKKRRPGRTMTVSARAPARRRATNGKMYTRADVCVCICVLYAHYRRRRDNGDHNDGDEDNAAI